MHEPTQKCENNAIFKHNHCLKLFIAFIILVKRQYVGDLL